LSEHKSPLDANILHQDVYIANVILTIAENDSFLINLDLLKVDREGASRAQVKLETKIFMAISTRDHRSCLA
jgi:hypothetical protein